MTPKLVNLNIRTQLIYTYVLTVISSVPPGSSSRRNRHKGLVVLEKVELYSLIFELVAGTSDLFWSVNFWGHSAID